MSLNQEIRDLLASFNAPAELRARVADAFEQVEQSGQAPGLAVGDRAPDFMLPDAGGRSVRLSDRLAQGPVALSFFRGAWCPICSLHIAALHRALPRIREAGGSLIAVHPDVDTFQTGQDLGFDILRDADQSVIDAYRVRFRVPADLEPLLAGSVDLDAARRNPDGSLHLPVPGTYIIDQESVVRRRHVSADYTRRMEPDDVLAALAELRGE